MDWSFLDAITIELMLSWAWKVNGALLILLTGHLAIRVISAGAGMMMKRHELSPMLIGFLSKVIYLILLAMVIVWAVSFAGVPIAPVVAILGGAVLAVGLAVQGSLSNLAAGVMLVLFRPFRVDDYVEAGGATGTVIQVKLFHTVLTTSDNNQVVVPNSLITGDVITNYSLHENRRVDLVIGVSYNDDLELARETIMSVLENHDKVLTEPEPVVMLLDLADSSVNIAVRPWVESSEYWPVRGELLEQIKVALEDAGCSIPFPQRDVHHFDMAANDAAAGGG